MPTTLTTQKKYSRFRDTVENKTKQHFSPLPWQIQIEDWTGKTYAIGQDTPHWYQKPLTLVLKTPGAGQQLLDLNGFNLVEKYLSGEIDLHGNFYLLSSIKRFVPIDLNIVQFLKSWFSHRYFQTTTRARVNVKSHYDMPQSLLERYLDQTYMAYSCAMFSSVELSHHKLDELIQPGNGEEDTTDSLEKAQWRKFKDAVDFIAPKEGETLLDVGCGYGGQLEVALQNHPFGKVVGWTHSNNQVTEGQKKLNAFETSRWELNEGDYRQDDRQFDHICSTGMVSHVGPRGLVPYVKNIRRRIKKDGRYVHHALMATYNGKPLDAMVGIAFNKKYVWRGFHWFPLSAHIKALEQNGFKVLKVVNLRDQYCKTLVAWYERMMQHENFMRQQMGEATFRAWRLYLGGGAGPDSGDVNRIYCVAV